MREQVIALGATPIQKCEGSDGEDDQYIVTVTDDGRVHPFAYNPFSDDEFAGATFSPDGQTLFVNIQGDPALTFAIWGPWKRG